MHVTKLLWPTGWAAVMLIVILMCCLGLSRNGRSDEDCCPGSTCENGEERAASPPEPVDFKIVPFDKEGKIPKLRIELPWEADPDKAILVRFPEIINYSTGDPPEQLRLYVDNAEGAEASPYPPKELPVKWTHTDTGHSYRIEFVNGMGLDTSIERKSDGAEINYAFTNGSDEPVRSLSIWTCVILSQSPSFRNLKMGRTFVHTAKGWATFDSAVIDRYKYDQDQWHYFPTNAKTTRAAIASQSNPTIRHFPHAPGKTFYCWTVQEPIDIPLIAEVTENLEYVIATASKSATTVWSNPYINCQHSDPVTPLVEPGATANVRVRLYIYKGSGDHLVDLYRRDFEG